MVVSSSQSDFCCQPPPANKPYLCFIRRYKGNRLHVHSSQERVEEIHLHLGSAGPGECATRALTAIAHAAGAHTSPERSRSSGKGLELVKPSVLKTDTGNTAEDASYGQVLMAPCGPDLGGDSALNKTTMFFSSENLPDKRYSPYEPAGPTRSHMVTGRSLLGF